VKRHEAALTLAAACAVVASVAGCAALKTPESQLFGQQGRYQSASITYRVEHNAARRDPPGPAWLALLDPKAAAQGGQRRTTTLAVRYPHPSGRAGYARVECIVEADSAAAANDGAPPGWLARARRLADDALPGIALGDGVLEAMALDVPMAELEPAIARLQQPAGAPSGPSSGGARITATLNGAALPGGTHRVAELERLVARVRREGRIMSHRGRTGEPASTPAEPIVAAAVGAARSPAADLQGSAATALPAAVVAAGYAEPATRRLPPVETPGG
jgi:hypothetical protein